MAIVKKYLSEVVSILNPFEGLYTVTFKSRNKFRYLPGQFLHLALDEYDGAGQWPESRCFSMQSSPDEELIKITYAVKGRFTERMQRELHPGKEVWLKLPFGDLFQRDHSKENCVFIAGGTGITPFLSLFVHSSFAEFINPKLYLGFRAEHFNLYSEELNRSTNRSNKIKIFYENVDGMLDINTIYKENGSAIYYLSGPPLMLKNFKTELTKFGVQEKNIVTDDWE
ncbi:MAG: FAD-dependent oxidoreductase [Ignavibacteriaceae bacterium]|nr:FAD-dependent oxidoreductase [Ignavibacteriaceae bacterium]